MNLYFVRAQWIDKRGNEWTENVAIETDMQLKTEEDRQIFTKKVKGSISDLMGVETGSGKLYYFKILNISGIKF